MTQAGAARRSLAAAAIVLVPALGSCGDAGQAVTVERWEVWVCQVPAVTVADPYDRSPLGHERITLAPEGLVEVLAEVTTWFEQVSYGRYRPQFEPGGSLALADDEGPTACVDRVERTSRAASVLAVADAVHPVDASGGFGRAGAVYLGAADFHPDWGPASPLDLVEHEMGHALGWGHSGVDDQGRYLSGLDLMSDSGALRRFEPAARHAPPPSAVHRAAAGWIPERDVVSVASQPDSEPVRVELHPASETRGVRLLRLPTDGGWIAVELIADPLAPGLGQGLAIHLVRDAPDWRMDPQLGDPPYTDLLADGERWEGHSWTVRAAAGAETWTVEVGRL